MFGAELLPVVAQLAASLGLLTPLILGLYGIARDKKKEAAAAAQAPTVEPATDPGVDFETLAVQVLKDQIAGLKVREAELVKAKAELVKANGRLARDLERARLALIAGGLPLP